jgi:hypothetical protein
VQDAAPSCDLRAATKDHELSTMSSYRQTMDYLQIFRPNMVILENLEELGHEACCFDRSCSSYH